MANAFADTQTGEFKKDWEARGKELAELLTKPELDAARRSTRNAHYTSQPVIESLWSIAERLGFRGGLALEPSSGTGSFLGLIPQNLAGNTRFVGVEYDSLTARIAQALYPQSTILHSGFQKVPLADGAFDLVIGNPPFGEESLRFQYKPELNRLSIHNQFFVAGVEALRPGGIEVMVVTRYLMDAKDATARRMLAERAKLLGVIRLPDTAFKENARTEVVTDIVILQRHTDLEEAEMAEALKAARDKPEKLPEDEAKRRELARKVPDWIETTEVKDPLGGEPMTVNRYFAQHPEMIVGRLERSGKMQFERDAEGNKAGGVNVKLQPGQSMEVLLAEAVRQLPENVMQQEDAAIQASIERYATMADALKIALSGKEIGHVERDVDGNLVQIIERETPEGDYEPLKRTLTEASPWSDSLMMDAQGRWYTQTPKLDADGAPVKVMKGDRATNLNVYERKTFANEADIPASMRLGKLNFDRLGKLAALRDLMKAQIVLESEDAPAAQMEQNRKKLAAAYKAFVAEHGLINTPSIAKVVSSMPDEALVLSLEHDYRPAISKARAAKTKQKPRAASATPAPILSQRVVPKYEPPTRADTPADALAITMSESGRVKMDRIAGLLGISEEEAAAKLQEGDKPLVFQDPETKQWETADAYLSGLVKRKLNAARDAGMELNIKALEAVQPEPWGSENVTAHIGSTWIPANVYSDFIQHLTGEAGAVSFAPVTNSFQVTANNRSIKAKQWSSDDVTLSKLVSDLLNSQTTRVTWEDSDGKVHVNQEATDLAQIKAKEIASEFEDWVFGESDRRGKLVDIFNERFNNRMNRQHDGSHLKLPGKVPDTIIAMRRHQMNTIWRGISERFMLIDHVVGAGKTFTAVARAMERRRMQLSRKPTIVVPNHLVESWAAEVYRLYPGAKLLAAGKKDFERSRRRKLFAKIATGDWDIVILPHSSFGFIGISPDTEGRFLEEELRIANQAIDDAWEQAAEDGSATGRRKPFNVKEAERLAEKIQNRLDGLNNRTRDRLLTFEQLGIDDLTIDEAHEFKNLFYNSRLSGVRGLGNKSGSTKAFDLYNKVRVLRESPTGTVTFMTGTPISNSAVEMYTMMRYLAADALKDSGLEHFDAWRAQFVEATSKWEPTESGRLKQVNRLGRNWSNMRSLMDLYYSFTDAVTQEDITRWYAEDNNGAEFPIPKVKGGGRKAIVVKPTPAQEKVLGEVIEGFDGLPNISDPYERNAERLRLMDRARKVALDVRAVDRRNPSTEEGGKLDRVSDEVARIYKAWNDDRGTQLVFLDRSVPNAKGDDKLVKAYDKAVAEREAALAANNEDRYRNAVEALEKFDENEVSELREALKGGWNAYLQIKRSLIERGVPEDEIRFIQEATDDAQKKAIFDAVNDGVVRVLIGSTPRMGAGTNVQQRLVALHHVDVTWKPSDIEQREGRIIRQGNRLLQRIGTSFEVEILTYVTERTVDAKLWDVNSTKLRMINGIRKYGGEFNMDFPDDEAVGMAEIAALASGDPLLLERVKLTAEIDQLERMRRAHTRKINGIDDARSTAERDIERLPKQIEDIKERAAALTKAIEAVNADERARSVTIEGKTLSTRFDADKFVDEEIKRQKGGDENAKFALNIDGNRYTSKTAVAEAIAKALGDFDSFLMTVEGERMISRGAAAKAILEPVNAASKALEENGQQAIPLGEWFGLKLEADVERTLEWGKKFYSYRLTLSLTGPDGRTWASDFGDRTDKFEFSTQYVRGVIQSIEKDVANMARNDAAWAVSRLAQAKEELPSLTERVKETWPQQDELTQKQDRLERVIKLLSGAEAPTVAAAARVMAMPAIDQGYDMAGDAGRARGLPQYRRADSPADQALAITRVHEALGDTPSRLSVPTRVYATAAEASRELGFEMPSDILGVHYQGQISLIAENLKTPEAVEFTLWHEAFHAGADAIERSEGFNAFADALRRVAMSNPNVRRAAFVWREKYGSDEADMLRQFGVSEADIPNRVLLKSWEEAIADISGANPNLRNLDRLVAALQTLLRKLGLERLAAWMEGKTNAEVLALIRRAREALTPEGAMVLRGDAAPAMHRAWHGSPHNFTTFSLDHIGTGEGAHAYGWGLYFAENARIAEGYQKRLSGGGYELNGVRFDGLPSILTSPERAVVEKFARMTHEGLSPSAAVEGIRADAKAALAQSQANLKEATDRLGETVDLGPGWGGLRKFTYSQDEIDESNRSIEYNTRFVDLAESLTADSVRESKGALYQVEIPDEAVARMLDWDKPLSEQSADIRQRLNTLKLPARGLAKLNATDAEDLAFMYSEETGEGYYNLLTEVLGTDKAASKALNAAGIPGIRYLDAGSRTAGDGTRNLVLFDDSLARVEAKFSRGPDEGEGASEPSFSRGPILQQTRDAVGDLFHSNRTFNRWWHTTVGTQYHKAQTDPHFKRVFNTGQDFLNDVSLFSMRAEAAAPDILLSLETFGEIFTKRRISQADSAKVGEALFQGTLDDTVYTDDELRTVFGMSDKQVGLYRQARKAISHSLDELTKSQMAKMAHAVGISHRSLMRIKDEDSTLSEFFDRVRDLIEYRIGALDTLNINETDQAKIDQRNAAIARMREQIKAMTKLFNRIAKLKNDGYAPLMRFGQYTVSVRDVDDNHVYFGMYESQAEANRAARAFREDMPDASVQTGVLSQEQFRLFQGLTPETVELFALNSGLDKDELFQDYLRLAVNNRGALTRLIHRKETPGFSSDVPRVLAQFVTSNARLAAANFHAGEMMQAIDDIPKRKGDVKDEAIKLRDYLVNPREEAAALRGFLFFNFIGGSIASAIVNATQPVTMTAPYLTKYASDAVVAKEMAKASMEAAKNAPGPDVADAYKRALERGIIAPHEIHQLMAEARGAYSPTGLSKLLGGQYARGVSVTQRVLKGWGAFFAMAEAFNRRTTFIAAYRIAVANSHPDPFDFAAQTVADTQGLYNKGNRPNWARGAVGATLFTFKQFSISYIEWLKRLPAKQRLRALAILFLAAGLQGLPFAEDIEDIIDAVGQWLGYGTNTKQWLRQHAADLLGEMGGQFVNHGISAFLPLDISARMGLGNLIPGTGLLKRSNPEKGRDVVEFLGPVGGVAGKLLEGNVAGAFVPKAIMDAVTGIRMHMTDEFRNPDGQLIARDITLGEAVTKGVGFNPDRIARQGRKVMQNAQDIRLVNATEDRIAAKWAQGIIEKDAKKTAEAQRDLKEWNEKNPSMRIAIEARQLQQRVAKLHQTREERTIKRAPKEIRGAVAKDLKE